MDVRAVTYDLWLTLLVDEDPLAAYELRARAAAEALDVSIRDAERHLRTAYTALHACSRTGRAMTVPDIAALLVREAGADPDAVSDLVDALESPTSDVGVRLLPGAREALETVTVAGLPLGLICDTGMSSGQHLRHLLDDLGVLEAFTVTVFSDETGVPKPGLRPFTLALAGVGVAPGDAVHIGDIRRRDVAGALGAGMSAIRYRGGRDDPDTESPDAEHVVDTHDEALALLGLRGG